MIGEEEVKKLIKAFPGGQIYLRVNYLDTRIRNEIIRNDFYSSDLSPNELAEKYNLSVSSINKIIGNRSK